MGSDDQHMIDIYSKGKTSKTKKKMDEKCHFF